MDDNSLKMAAIEIASEILDPATQTSLLDAHMLEEVEATGGVVRVKLLVPKGYAKDHRWQVEDELTDKLEAHEAIERVEVQTFVEGYQEHAAAEAEAKAAAEAEAKAAEETSQRPGTPGAGPQQAKAPTPNALVGVGRVIAVASGKGGVGKSTVSVNLALALQRLGFRVGLLDVDVYGPSVPTLLGVSERPNVQDRRILPIEAAGLRVMSLGFHMDDDAPVIWRGPIVTGIIRQFLQDVDWEGTDYLIVDMPPGTGDAQLSLAQTVPVDGAVVVTTPSDLALIDAARGLRMFQTLNVDVLGIVENMASFAWPGTAQVEAAIASLEGVEGAADALASLKAALDEHGQVPIFGSGGGRREAERLETAFLGEIPLDGAIRAGGDEGKPIMLTEPEGPVGRAFLDLAEKVSAAKPLEAGGDGAGKKGLFSFLKS